MAKNFRGYGQTEMGDEDATIAVANQEFLTLRQPRAHAARVEGTDRKYPRTVVLGVCSRARHPSRGIPRPAPSLALEAGDFMSMGTLP